MSQPKRQVPTPFYKLDFFQGEVYLDKDGKAKNAQMISPDVDYWEPVFKMKLVSDLEDSYVQMKPNLIEFYSNYWVEKPLHDAVSKLCKSLSIDKKHVDDLCVPLSDFRRTKHNTHGHDIHQVARDVLNLRKVIELIRDQKLDLIDVSFTLGQFLEVSDRTLDDVKNANDRKHDIGFDARYAEETFKKIESINITKARALHPFTQALKTMADEDGPFKAYLNNPDWEGIASRSPSKFFRLRKDRMAHIVYRFLINHNISANPNDASGKMGLFISLVDTKYGMSEEEFQMTLPGPGNRQAYFAQKFSKKMKAIDAQVNSPEK